MYFKDDRPFEPRKLARTGPRARRYYALDKLEKERQQERLDALHLWMDEICGKDWARIPRELIFSRAYRAGQREKNK
ncbi:MAG: hypothetical protein V3T23_01730 [Nitrososphaerales archaeon]